MQVGRSETHPVAVVFGCLLIAALAAGTFVLAAALTGLFIRLVMEFAGLHS